MTTKGIKILASSSYLPETKVINKTLEENLELKKDFIYTRTGIKQRYYEQDGNIEKMAIDCVKSLLKDTINTNIEMIIVATTTPNSFMPGISFVLQKELGISRCICMDVLGGCAGFINAFDIACAYINCQKVKNAIIVGVDILSKYTDKTDINTKILLSDGAGAIYIEKSKENKKYYSNIQSDGQNGNILTCVRNNNIFMNGKEVYKYAVTKTVENIKELLETAKLQIEDIKYIIPHQSNVKILKSIASRLNINVNKIYINIGEVGNTFCASIPIALSEVIEKKLIKQNDKIILLGYGGGLNTGSILLEY